MTYHVVQGTVYSIGLSDGQMVKTVEGKELAVKIDNGKTLLQTHRKDLINIVTVSGFCKLSIFIFLTDLLLTFDTIVFIS